MKIIPSLLTYSLEELNEQVERLRPYYNHFQIDIVDQSYSEHKTITLSGVLDLVQSNYLKDITVDFDLMISNPEFALGTIRQVSSFINVDAVFLHYKYANPELLTFDSNMRIGIALDPEDSVEKLGQMYNLEIMPVMQIMTVVPGKQGQSFMPEVLDKIDQLRSANYRNEIYVDGAVNESTIPVMQKRIIPPDVVCPGSYLSKAGDKLEERVKWLNSL
jgi:ribulose-phosphate 3-epimerase